MANFYNSTGILIDKAYEYPCIYEDIYILGLKEGEILISYNPSFMQNANGILIGVDSRFSHFYIVNRNESIVKSLRLNWVTDCTEEIKLPIINANYIPIIICGFGIMCLVIYFLITRRKK